MTTDTYLLASEQSGTEYVAQFTTREMDELFSADERRDLNDGKSVILVSRLGGTRYVDMLVAARKVVD